MISLFCHVDALPNNVTYLWTFDGKYIGSGKDLTIAKADIESAGVYTCTAENKFTTRGQLTQEGGESASFTVTVQCRFYLLHVNHSKVSVSIS